MCVLRNLLEVHMHFNEYKNLKVKSSTITAGYDVGVTNMIKVHPVMMKPLRGQFRLNFIKQTKKKQTQL